MWFKSALQNKLCWILSILTVTFLFNSQIKLIAAESDSGRPNILWITSEDNGPHLGCYGDQYANTPHIDKLASQGTLYLNCWSTAPVCAPARTTLITGMYPTCLGAEHMRSMVKLPDDVFMYPHYLRKSGYYCTNNSKEDYNVAKTGTVWDQSSRKAHWKNRKPGQPFFAVFNHTISHESKIRNRPHTLVHDPAKVRIPAYHPDTPEVRHDWAQYYDRITEMDALVGKNLKELADAGLADDTIIFYYGDHGSGMPRSKRWPYNSGLQVPLVVYIPPKFRKLASADYQTQGKSDRLVGFVDFAPTLLSLAGIKPPAYMQGNAFMGQHEATPQTYQFGFRGRMDERYDLVRSVRNKRYLYIKNYMPHKEYGQYLNYMFQTPTTQVWKKMYDAGELSPPQTYFWETKPAEELYDLQADRDEVHNLVKSDQHQKILAELREAQHKKILAVRDLGFLPEAEVHSLSDGGAPYLISQNSQLYPLKQILAMAEIASSGKPDSVNKLIAGLDDQNSAIRYWAAMGLLMRGEGAVKNARNKLRESLDDSSKSVRCIAAEALGEYGNQKDVQDAVNTLYSLSNLNRDGVYIAILALNGLDKLGNDKVAPVKEKIAQLPLKNPQLDRRLQSYVMRLIERIQEKTAQEK
ncbi:sulfatase-like hydrolase/transferase [uncultured Gimesia sp.]|mgnify:CR=1 FL=1|uniref:sulfatase-like hydrolase/transferase n=1 Tax=uncultured Gimesia sp. TaxID=1678688 RepID=UPI0026042AB5|nr:sulfatase-like hydrolase/transferase [uncultured Gimesia sp.]